ncbi:hypothetical protein Pan216_20860 [Planctomycetes bacterium Pan216]|uniref:GYF domain-containing protein n=1 Tax=Kolteria novifilia TaxID=2527975 RepID=A0A518B2R7_9BACT|nr:hypothetical protein Pan216_20860 [Planctomycetes bacterium Pan216]
MSVKATTRWHYKDAELGSVVGPCSIDDIARLVSYGTITESTLVSTTGKKWAPASRATSIRHFFESPTSGPDLSAEPTAPDVAVPEKRPQSSAPKPPKIPATTTPSPTNYSLQRVCQRIFATEISRVDLLATSSTVFFVVGGILLGLAGFLVLFAFGNIPASWSQEKNYTAAYLLFASAASCTITGGLCLAAGTFAGALAASIRATLILATKARVDADPSLSQS